jgi:sugar phosphate isomerase/epimerase
MRRRTAELSVKAAEVLGVPRLNLHTAELVDGQAARPRQRATGQMWLTAARALERIGEIQVADVPGRCEPGSGEINYPAVAKALRDIGYEGTVGLEAFRAAFTA